MVNMEGMCRPELESSECRTFWAFASHHQAGIELLEKLVPALVGLFKVGTQDHGRGKPLEVFKMGKEYDKFWKPWMHAGGCRVLLYRAFDQSAWSNLVNHNNRDFRLVHIVKDPLQLTLDGYLYHLHHTDHERLKVTPHTLQALDEADGLLLEAREELRTSTADITAAIAASADSHHVLTIGIEDFADVAAAAVAAAAVAGPAGPVAAAAARRAGVAADALRDGQS